jgi:hypothetical protein
MVNPVGNQLRYGHKSIRSLQIVPYKHKAFWRPQSYFVVGDDDFFISPGESQTMENSKSNHQPVYPSFITLTKNKLRYTPD